MKRTINLYQESLKPQKEKLPFDKVLWINGGAFVVMLALTIVFNVLASSKESALKARANDVSVLNNELKQLQAKLEEKRDITALEAQLADVQKKIQNREALFEFVESGELSNDATQFVEVMRDLATYHHSDLWLTQIEIDPSKVRLTGQTVTPAAVPIWLKKLEQSPFFKGKSFSHVKFDQVADKDRVRTFVISTDFEGETNESVSAAL